MDEFSLIDTYFNRNQIPRADVILGIGDDAACVELKPLHQLVVSTDTLVECVHFLSDWDAYDIGYRSVMVNVSDIAAMGATPCWALLALTLPNLNKGWLERFSNGLHDALNQFNIRLIGGDTTSGPLTITLTLQGQVLNNKAITRSGAKSGNIIWVSGELGGAAAALKRTPRIPETHYQRLQKKLMAPVPRVDLQPILAQYATAAVDISDGLSADLNHICRRSKVGACLSLADIPIHPLVEKYYSNPLTFALSGGDDYELCFTTPAHYKVELVQAGLYPIGVITENTELTGLNEQGEPVSLVPRGFKHF